MCLDGQSHAERIEITVVPHGGIRGALLECQRPAPGYDRLPERRWLFCAAVGDTDLVSATRHGGSSAPSMAWWLNIFHGATASGR